MNEEFLILDPDVNVRAKDEQLLREVLKVFPHARVAFERRDLLRHPRRERMRSRGRDDEAVPAREVHYEPAESNELAAQLGRSATHLASDLDHRLVQLR